MQKIWTWSLGREEPWRRKWQPTPVFLPGRSHWQRSLASYHPWGRRRVRHDLATKQQKQSSSLLIMYLFSKISLGNTSFFIKIQFSSVQLSSSVVSDTLWPHGLQHARPPCLSPLPEFTQTHVHWVHDAIQPSKPLSSPSPPIFNLSQHQGLFQSVSSSH